MWSISASVRRTPASGVARSAPGVMSGQIGELLARSGEALIRNQRRLPERTAIDDCVRG